MSTSTILDCHIFVYSSLSLDQLAKLLNSVLPGTLSQGRSHTLQTAAGEVDFRKNPDFDALRSQEFPDGFLFFPYSLEFYAHPEQSLEARIDLVTKVLEALWSQSFPAVAACDYEDMLPRTGGNK